jgi:Acetoacetate decarboxylase (ADC)/SnoaL-like domain
MAGSKVKQKPYIPHPNAPSARLATEQADNSGVVNTDPQFMADRLAILNHVGAYSYLIDEGRWEEWFALFADDFEFVSTTPTLGTVTIRGQNAFREFVGDRYIKGGATSPAVRRHTAGNFHVTHQSATTANVRTYMMISNVPNADKLLILTTGTYNARLEKRDGKWTITRWYIECDAPLSPSKLPDHFPPEEFRWDPDPYTAMPGAGPVAVPVNGHVTLKNHPFAMPASGPLYENAPVWTWDDIDVVLVDYLTDANSAAAFLPEQMTTLPIPEMPGYSAVKQVWAHYKDSSFGPYDEFFIVIPSLHKGELFLYVPLIYVDNDSAMSGGREIGGWPKKMGQIRMDRFGSEYRCSFERRGQRLASASMQVGAKMFSTPLPADKAVSLPYPYNMTLPLPPPTGKAQDSVPLPTATLKMIPGVGAGKPTPVVARLIGAPWRMKGAFFSGSGASIAYGQSENDPFYKLPNLHTLGASYFQGQMTLAFTEMRVLEDMLKK